MSMNVIVTLVSKFARHYHYCIRVSKNPVVTGNCVNGHESGFLALSWQILWQ